MRIHKIIIFLSLVILLSTNLKASSYDDIAVNYVKLVLALGEHDEMYVDAYYGPPALREEARSKKLPLKEIGEKARALIQQLQQSTVPDEELTQLRRDYLIIQLKALLARTEILKGKKMSFDEESIALYNALPPTHPYSYYDEKLKKVEALLPGKGTLAERYSKFQESFVIPKEKLDALMRRSLEECRLRTLPHVSMPKGESFVVEYVQRKPWSAYNWYKGNFHSLIEVNTDQPAYIDYPVGLACHEGYPGHHAYNAMLESSLVKGRNWVEFTVYPLYSPQSLVAEGSAEYGIELAFPGKEREAFEKSVLFPMAGISTENADRFYELKGLVEDLGYAKNDIARDYLGGKMSRDEAIRQLQKYSLTTAERATQSLQFTETYRSYIINYNLGQDLVKEYIESVAGKGPEKRWQKFAELISSPRLISNVKSK